MKLRELMKARKVSVSELAEKLGITRQALYNKINEVSEFTFDEAQKIKEIFELSDEQLIEALKRD